MVPCLASPLKRDTRLGAEPRGRAREDPSAAAHADILRAQGPEAGLPLATLGVRAIRPIEPSRCLAALERDLRVVPRQQAEPHQGWAELIADP